jgi:hypothetical protein
MRRRFAFAPGRRRLRQVAAYDHHQRGRPVRGSVRQIPYCVEDRSPGVIRQRYAIGEAVVLKLYSSEKILKLAPNVS